MFIQNEAGSNRKHYHDEKTLEWKQSVEVSRRYPFPYGFILGTTGADGCNLDCFVITQQPLRTEDIVDCELLGLMEQFEDGADDHNVLARLVAEECQPDSGIESTLSEFVIGVFSHVADKRMIVGRFLGPGEAAAHVAAHLDQPLA